MWFVSYKGKSTMLKIVVNGGMILIDGMRSWTISVTNNVNPIF